MFSDGILQQQSDEIQSPKAVKSHKSCTLYMPTKFDRPALSQDAPSRRKGRGKKKEESEDSDSDDSVP